jgi:hypothetical protein
MVSSRVAFDNTIFGVSCRSDQLLTERCFCDYMDSEDFMATKKDKGGRPSTKGDDPVHIGCTIPRALFDRLEAFKDERMAQRAAIMQRAIEQFLDREAPKDKN